MLCILNIYICVSFTPWYNSTELDKFWKGKRFWTKTVMSGRRVSANSKMLQTVRGSYHLSGFHERVTVSAIHRAGFKNARCAWVRALPAGQSSLFRYPAEGIGEDPSYLWFQLHLFTIFLLKGISQCWVWGYEAIEQISTAAIIQIHLQARSKLFSFGEGKRYFLS